jgi:DNA polymerase III delta prime subunit
MLWDEKYGPKDFNEVVGNKKTVARFQKMFDKKEFRNLILCGPNGSGKNLLVEILVKKLFNSFHHPAILYIGTAEDRSIQTIREKIQGFVPKRLDLQEGVPRFIIFEEISSVSEGVQQMMRRIMEKIQRDLFSFS